MLPDDPRAFVGIDCDVPHPLSFTLDSYRGAYVAYGVPGQVHSRRSFMTGDPVADFGRAFRFASTATTNVYVSGTAEFFAKRSGGVYELRGCTLVRRSLAERTHAA